MRILSGLFYLCPADMGSLPTRALPQGVTSSSARFRDRTSSLKLCRHEQKCSVDPEFHVRKTRRGLMSIFGIGTVVVDHAVLLHSFPECDTKNQVSRSWKQIGGPVPVALSTASSYGNECHLLGRWGRDDAGTFLERGLIDRGLNFAASESQSDWSTGFAQVWVTADAKRTIAYSRGEFPLPNADNVTREQIGSARILHLDGWAGEAAIAAAQIMRDLGGTVVLDAGSMKPGTRQLFPLVDILVASELFRHSCFGKAAVSDHELRSLNCRSVITTHGPNGARWLTDDHVVKHAGFAVSAVDTNGAGDIFCGAILHAIGQGWEKLRSIEFANAVAALACESFGNSNLPRLDQVHDLINRS